MSKRKAGEGKNSTGGVVVPLVSSTIAPLAAANQVTYAVGVRMYFLDHTNLLPDLVSIIQEYTAFSGVERLTFSGHTAEVYCVAVFPNGNICSSSLDCTIKIWNRVNGQCVQTLTGEICKNNKNKYIFVAICVIFFLAKNSF